MAAKQGIPRRARRIAGGLLVGLAALLGLSFVISVGSMLHEAIRMGFASVVRVLVASVPYAVGCAGILYAGLRIGWPKEVRTAGQERGAAMRAQRGGAAEEEPAGETIAAPRQASAIESEPVRARAAFPKLMTGQLVALYKRTHEVPYHDEYVRRLRFIGFSEPEAENFFMYELMTIKHDAVQRLADPGYLMGAYFDLGHVLLSQPSEYYVEHQSFLCSEIVKIWDEAEWHYWNSHERDLPSEVWGEIYSLSRYGGGKLFVDYLASMAEHAHTPLEKVRAYSMAEQQLLFKYKWNADKDERHPYER